MGAEAEVMAGLTPDDSLSLLSYSIRGYQARGSTTHRKLGPTMSIINQKICPTGQPGGSIFSVEISSSRMTLTGVKMK